MGLERTACFAASKTDNLKRARQENTIGAKSANWVQNVSWAVSRRFDPAGRDRPLVELAKSGCDREVWKPLLLYHLTRDELLVRDFLVSWLYPRFSAGAYRLRSENVLPYLHALIKRSGFGVRGSGFGVRGSGFRVRGAGCGVQGAGCRVQG